MPVRAGLLVVDPPGDTTPAPVVIVPRLRDAPRASYFAPDGTEVPLTSPELGWKTLRGVSGLGAIGVNLTTDKLPRGGVRVRSVRREHREFDWPIRVYGRTSVEKTARLRYLTEKFTQTDELGPGRLVITYSDGSLRQIDVWYLQGLEDTEDGWIAENAVITFLAETPWWFGPNEESDQRVQSAAPGDYLDGYPNVATSKTLGATELFNPGELMAFPTWTFTGPASLITVTHSGTGESFTLDPDYAGGGSLGSGDTITVQTDPMRIVGPAGTAFTGALNWPGAALFGLRPGDNRILFAFTDADAGSGVAWTYKPRYRRA